MKWTVLTLCVLGNFSSSIINLIIEPTEPGAKSQLEKSTETHRVVGDFHPKFNNQYLIEIDSV